MNALVLGGNRFFGRHLVEGLVEAGYNVTLLNRGLSGDPFGDRVDRIACDRGDGTAMKGALAGRTFDVVYDNIAYSSKDVKALLDGVEPGRYMLTSSVSVYTPTAMGQREEDFDSRVYPLRWVERGEVDYGEGKRQAECAAFQHFSAIPAVAVRFPYVIGPQDYTGRLRFYVQNTLAGQAMHIDNPRARLSFIHEEEAGRFLTALAGAKGVSGPMNGAATGTVSLEESLAWIGHKTGVMPALSPSGVEGPYNGAEDFSLDTAKAGENLGYAFSRLEDWYWDLLDDLIQEARV